MLVGVSIIVIGYLLGSFPSAYLMAKVRKGVDIREVDYTGNMGAGAVFRQVGLWEGAVVAVADMGKGAATVALAQAIELEQPWVLAAGFAAILGHNFPLYVGFRGGHGVDTIIGIFLVISPLAMAAELGIMGLALLLTRHIFTMTCISAPFLPLFLWLFNGIDMIFYYSLVIIAYLLFRNRHRLKEFRPLPGKAIEQEHAQPAHQDSKIASFSSEPGTALNDCDKSLSTDD